jgi:opacity protein-like surface antigen
MNRKMVDPAAAFRRALLRAFALSALAALLLLLATSRARAVEVVPSVGLTRSVDADEANSQVGLALRGDIAPRVLQAEIGASYRREDAAPDVVQRMWPVTASLWLTPLSALYAGAGVGWYHTTFDYKGPLALEDETFQDFGVHLGGGMKVPLASSVAVDLNGRYVMMQDQEDSRLVPSDFNPDFWTLAAGLAFKF